MGRLRDCADAVIDLVERRLELGPIPGAVFGVIDTVSNPVIRAAGYAQVVPNRRPMTVGTWFDLASLTKPIVTATKILDLVDHGCIRLDDPLTTLLPDLRQYDGAARERALSYLDCLAHRTHLPAVAPIYTYGLNPRTARAFILQREWPVGAPVYSDIGYMLLGIALERKLNVALCDLDPGHGLTFSPSPEQCAATEFCPWRGRVLVGEVHDENAHAFGGAAGHAGLFGTASGVLGFAQSLLAGQRSQAMISAMRQRVYAARTAGWEIVHPGWSGGDHCLPGTIGHTGFTGTGLWIDFERELGWTLLTNRVHPSRHVDSGIKDLRRDVAAIVSKC